MKRTNWQNIVIDSFSWICSNLWWNGNLRGNVYLRVNCREMKLKAKWKQCQCEFSPYSSFELQIEILKSLPMFIGFLFMLSFNNDKFVGCLDGDLIRSELLHI